jgi:superfamily I DNA and/or RNA helicase
VKKIKCKLAFGTCSEDVKVGTIEEFQGQERHIVVLSAVRTSEKHFKKDKKYDLGFLQCEKRLNVAISRARSLLVVFGKENILKMDVNWNALIEYAKANGTYGNNCFNI